MNREDERLPKRQVRFEEDDDSNSEGDDLRRGQVEQDGRLQNNKQHSERPAAFQREPDRNHAGHNHNHGPTVDPAVIKMLAYKEITYPLLVDVTTLAYGVVMVGIAYLSFHFRESIIIDEIYEKFQNNREKFLKPIPITLVRMVPEMIKFYSFCAYDILVIMYLIKPIKAATKEERELTKQYQELLKKLSLDRANVQDNVRKIEKMQIQKSEMLSHRYTSYNAIMLQELKLGLSMDFILATLGFFSFFITSVTYPNKDRDQE